MWFKFINEWALFILIAEYFSFSPCSNNTFDFEANRERHCMSVRGAANVTDEVCCICIVQHVVPIVLNGDAEHVVSMVHG